AITQFNFGFGGALSNFTWGSNQVTASGLISDELMTTSSSFANGYNLDWDDRSTMDPARNEDYYTQVASARVNLQRAILAMQQAARDSTARIGQLFALLGFTEVFFGENFCNGVPLGSVDANLVPIYGKPLTNTELLQQAIADFDSASKYGAD